MFPPNDPAVAPPKKKRVLLVDTSRTKRDLRSETMRKLGIEVDCAADISEARCWWRADLYDLVLIHMEDSPGPLEKFCNDLRAATPPQQIMFLVGGPSYLSSAPGCEGTPQEEDNGSVSSQANNLRNSVSQPDAKSQRWGILEACLRISAIRSVCDARARAVRNRPVPQRDSETSPSSRVLDASTLEFMREELE
jgi:hypothetical protein